MADNIVKIDLTGTVIRSESMFGGYTDYAVTGYVEVNYTTMAIVNMSLSVANFDYGTLLVPGSFNYVEGLYTLSDFSSFPKYSIVYEGQQPAQLTDFYFTPNAEHSGAGILTNVVNSEPVCFLAGTLIRTPRGEVAVEELEIGDLVMTATGEALPVRWIGRRIVSTRFADPHGAYPVRIRAGALGEGLPVRDLFVSPSHAIWLDGVLVQARVLADGGAITQVKPQGEHFTYYHIEFDTHAVVLAEGLPAESYVDNNFSRRRFDNYAEFAALYGDDATVAEPSDAPRVTCRRQMPRRLVAQVAQAAEAVARTA